VCFRVDLREANDEKNAKRRGEAGGVREEEVREEVCGEKAREEVCGEEVMETCSLGSLN
jgi:hypothetical protein